MVFCFFAQLGRSSEFSFPFLGGCKIHTPNRCVQSWTAVMNPNCCLSKNSTSRWHTLVKVAQPCFPLVILMIHSPMGRWISAIVTVLLFLITRGITSSFWWFLSFPLLFMLLLPPCFFLTKFWFLAKSWLKWLFSSSWKRTRRSEGKGSTFTC